MSNQNNSGRIFAGKGYYIALILCAAAIGITGYLYSRNLNETKETMKVVGSEPTSAVTEASQPASEEATEKPTLKTAAPVAGQTVADFAADCLGYNETTRDWRTHAGVDIAAEAGTEVVAAADGQVYRIYEDETLGCTVVIRHAGGYTTCYSSLSQDLLVQEGDQVTMGQVIGTVGTTALVETVLGPHVHFSVTYQDTPMDPAEFFSLGE